MAFLLYTVQPGDVLHGLMGLAQRFYADTEHWLLLFSMNRHIIGDDPVMISAGQQLLIPYEKPDASDLCVRVYTVHPSDFGHGLRGIAARLLGDEGRWIELYQVNRGIIGDDVNRLTAGQILIVL